MLYCDLPDIFYCIQFSFELYYLTIKKYICTNKFKHIYTVHRSIYIYNIYI